MLTELLNQLKYSEQLKATREALSLDNGGVSHTANMENEIRNITLAVNDKLYSVEEGIEGLLEVKRQLTGEDQRG